MSLAAYPRLRHEAAADDSSFNDPAGRGVGICPGQAGQLLRLEPWATIVMCLLLVVPIVISLFIDTRLITGPGRRLLPGRRLWT
jgi:hypothetical protein